MTARGNDNQASDRFRRELARGTVELAVLALLGSGQKYGYELLAELNDVSGGVPEIKEGTLYPLLHRLEDAGHIQSTWHAIERNPPRKYYLLTDAGQTQLSLLKDEWSRLVAGMRRVLRSVEGAAG